MKNLMYEVNRSVLGLLCLFFIGMPVFAQMKSAPMLKVGDPAPPLAYAKWLKGEPISQFEQGKVYVVDFWATWCGPCRASIPHLSELANKYRKEVTIISMNVHELGYKKNANKANIDYIGKVERFVKASGDIMDYSVAVDKLEETMWNTWMTAAGIVALPTVFIIDRNKNIAWIGGPGGLDEVLPLVLQGRYNETTKKQLQDAQAKSNARYKEIFPKYRAAFDSGNEKVALELMDELVAIRPSLEDFFNGNRYQIFAKSDPAKAAVLGRQMLKKFRKNPVELGGFASSILAMEEDASVKPDYQLALEALQLAYSRSEKDDQSTLRALAKAYFKTGNVAKAIEMQSQAVDVLKKSEFVDYSKGLIDAEQKVLAQYKAAKQ